MAEVTLNGEITSHKDPASRNTDTVSSNYTLQGFDPIFFMRAKENHAKRLCIETSGKQDRFVKSILY